MQMYQRVFLITSTLESSTATYFVFCLLVLSYDLFSLNWFGLSHVMLSILQRRNLQERWLGIGCLLAGG